MKLKRFDPPGRYTKPLPWREDSDGDWCDADDVEKLELAYAHLLCAVEFFAKQDCKSEDIIIQQAWEACCFALVNSTIITNYIPQETDHEP